MIIRCAHKDVLSIDQLKAKFHPKNRNKHPEEQIQRLAEILKYQGIRWPVKISELSGFITAGHGRVLAAEKNGWTEFPVDYQEYESEEQEYADVQSDNAIAGWAELDLSGINSDIGDLGPDFDLDLLGIKDFVLEPAEKFEAQCDEDEVPEVKESFVKPGDIWQLGAHRLMCGDSTSIDAVERLMGEEMATVFLTDPPYGVGYADRQVMMNEWGKRTGLRGGNKSITTPIENDHGTIDECGEVWRSAYSNALISCHLKSSFYIFSPQGGDLMMMMMIQESGWTLKHMLVWVKNNHVLGRCDYHYKHEPIFYGWNQGHDFYGDRSNVSVLQFDRERANDLHPTMKPVELLEKLISNSSKLNDNVLDLFGGSGSTLIACEKTNRKCFMMEIDPHYCGVIIERWQKYTGKKAERIETGVQYAS